jgi:hypothetical protein
LSVSGLGIGFESVEFGLKRPRRSSFGFAWKFSVAPARAGDRNYVNNLKATALVAIELDRLGFIPLGNDHLAALLQQVMHMIT